MRLATFALFIACTPATQPLTSSHPAHYGAERGRLADPPSALTIVKAARPPPPPMPDPEAELVAAELAAYERAKPVFDKWCATCHVQGSKDATKKSLDYFDMSTYPFGGRLSADVTKEIRVVLGLVAGASPTMPRHEKGAVKGDDLAAIAAWADAFDASRAAANHDH